MAIKNVQPPGQPERHPHAEIVDTPVIETESRRSEPLMLQDAPKAQPSDASVYGHKAQFKACGGSEWYSCRDQFHSNVGTGPMCACKGFYYGAEDPFAVVAMLDWAERALNIKPEYRCKIHFCQSNSKKPRVHPVTNNRENMIYVELTDFWREDKIRFYFLTALVRSAWIVPKWKHPLDTILQVSYFVSTRTAVGAFLKGYTLMPSREKAESNWCNIFYGEEWRKMVRPSSSEQLLYFYDNNCRSNIPPDEKWRITQWVREATGDKYGDDGKPPFGF